MLSSPSSLSLTRQVAQLQQEKAALSARLNELRDYTIQLQERLVAALAMHTATRSVRDAEEHAANRPFSCLVSPTNLVQ